MIERTPTGHHAAIVAAAKAVAAVLMVAAGPLIVAGCGSSTPTASQSPSPAQTATFAPTDSPTPSPSPSPSGSLGPTAIPAGWSYSDLDGVAAPDALAHRLPMAIMIDDNAVARPQSGFTSASIVYQAPADGGEDRYMLVFQEGSATNIGPVRSARPYYVYWAAEYKAGYGHYGGDVMSLQQAIPAMRNNIYNMDALNGDACPYHRVTTRAAPHNAYTNTTALIGCAATNKQPATYQGLPDRTFTDDTPSAELPASQTISLPYHTGTVGYQFDPTSDSYLRIVDGQPQVDPASNRQVYARDVIVLFQVLSYDSVVDPGHNRPVIAVVGSGKAIVFKEGKATVGTWKKTSNTDLTRVYDSSGNEIPLVRGEIFIQSVPTGTAVTYQ